MSINSIRSVRFGAVTDPDDVTTAVIVAARSDHGDTEHPTPDGYSVNTGSYVHIDDVADYLLVRANVIRTASNIKDPTMVDTMAGMLESAAGMIRTAGV